MESRFKEWVYIEGLMQSAYHESALKMNLSDSEFWILYVFNFHQEGCNQSVLYKEACLTKSTVNSAIRKMEQKDLLYLTPGWKTPATKSSRSKTRSTIPGHLRNRNFL